MICLSMHRDISACKLCNLNESGDEFHYFLKCPFFSDRRKNTKFNKRKVNCLKMREIIIIQNVSKLKASLLSTRKIMSQLKNNNSPNQTENENLVYTSELTTRAEKRVNRPKM